MRVCPPHPHLHTPQNVAKSRICEHLSDSLFTAFLQMLPATSQGQPESAPRRRCSLVFKKAGVSLRMLLSQTRRQHRITSGHYHPSKKTICNTSSNQAPLGGLLGLEKVRLTHHSALGVVALKRTLVLRPRRTALKRSWTRGPVTSCVSLRKSHTFSGYQFLICKRRRLKGLKSFWL